MKKISEIYVTVEIKNLSELIDLLNKVKEVTEKLEIKVNLKN